MSQSSNHLRHDNEFTLLKWPPVTRSQSNRAPLACGRTRGDVMWWTWRGGTWRDVVDGTCVTCVCERWRAVGGMERDVTWWNVTWRGGTWRDVVERDVTWWNVTWRGGTWRDVVERDVYIYRAQQNAHLNSYNSHLETLTLNENQFCCYYQK